MRVIARRTLATFWTSHADAEQPLKSWFKYAAAADWDTPAAVKLDYRSASILQGNRVCFNIAGNKYRLIVKINYRSRTIFIRFIGTHAEYDRINANSI
jgi:mRNA interferase HigB